MTRKVWQAIINDKKCPESERTHKRAAMTRETCAALDLLILLHLNLLIQPLLVYIAKKNYKCILLIVRIKVAL